MDSQTQLPRTLHDRASEVVQRLRKLDMRLSRVTIGICGSCPETAENSAKSIEEHMHDKFDTINRLVNNLEGELMRLENSVGTNQPMAAKTATASGY